MASIRDRGAHARHQRRRLPFEAGNVRQIKSKQLWRCSCSSGLRASRVTEARETRGPEEHDKRAQFTART